MHDRHRTSLDQLLFSIGRLLSHWPHHSRAGNRTARTREAVIAVTVLCMGLASYTYISHALVHDRGTTLGAELERRSQQLTLALRGRVEVTRSSAAPLNIARAMEVYQSDEAGPIERTSALVAMQLAARSLLEPGDLRAVEFRTLGNDRITSAGHLPDLPQLSVPLLDGGDVLYWDEGLVLRTSVPVKGEDGIAGEIVADLRVWNANAAITGDERVGNTGQAALCGLSGARIICFPSRSHPEGEVSTLAASSESPAGRALSGESGTLELVDYRGRPTYSTFKPLDGHRLALVVNTNKSELLAPIKNHLRLGIAGLVLIAAGGVFLIGAQLRPLKAELDSAKALAAREVASRTIAEADIGLARRQLQHVADIAPFLIAFLDPNFIFRFANRAHVLWFQRPLDQIIGKPMDTLVDHVITTDYLEAMARALATDLPQTVLHERSWVGRSKFVELTFVAQLDASGQLEGYCLTARDATEAALQEQKLLLAARRDPLTGLCNRTSFRERLEQALGIVDSDASLLTIAYLDIDHFMHLNDRYGHDVGDQLLRELGRRIKAVLRPADTVARLGDDEIAVIMRLKAADDVRIVGSRLLKTIREPFLINEHRIEVTASIGFAIAVAGDSVSTLLERAQSALSEVKGGGRDGMVQAKIPDAPQPTMHDLTCQ